MIEEENNRPPEVLEASRTGGGISHAWRALRHRNFRLFFSGQSISLIGTWMTRIATSWLVYRLTGSALLLGLVGFMGQIPTFLLAPFAGARVTVPALYVAGDRDLVLAFPGVKDLVANLTAFVPQLRQTIILPGCGHWTQQERPEAVNAAMLDFLRGL